MKEQETPEQREKRLQAHIAAVREEQVRAATAELRAMDEVLRILHPLSPDSQKRAMRWVGDRLDNFTPPIATFLDDEECPF